MPTNSAWSDPDPDPQDPDLSFDPDRDDPIPTPPTPPSLPSPTASDLAASLATELVLLSEASSSANDSDWLGDDDYTDDGELIPPPARATDPSHPNAVARRFRPGSNRRLARAFERRRKVVEMKIEGYTYAEIAQTLGFNSIDGAKAAFKRAQQDVRDAAEEYRDLELARTDAVLRVLWPMVEQGDLEAVDKYLKVAALRVKITGMDKVAPMGHGGTAGSDDGANIERVAMVEDVQMFLAALPGIYAMSPQPQPIVIDQQGNMIKNSKSTEDEGHD